MNSLDTLERKFLYICAEDYTALIVTISQTSIVSLFISIQDKMKTLAMSNGLEHTHTQI